MPFESKPLGNDLEIYRSVRALFLRVIVEQVNILYVLFIYLTHDARCPQVEPYAWSIGKIREELWIVHALDEQNMLVKQLSQFSAGGQHFLRKIDDMAAKGDFTSQLKYHRMDWRQLVEPDLA